MLDLRVNDLALTLPPERTELCSAPRCRSLFRLDSVVELLPPQLLLPPPHPVSASNLCPPFWSAVPRLNTEAGVALLCCFSVAFPVFLVSGHEGWFWIDILARLSTYFLLWGKRTSYSALGVSNLWYFGSAWQGVLLLGTHGLSLQLNPFSFWSTFRFRAVLAA